MYLARKANPPHFLQTFIGSLRRYPADCPFDLLLIFKGYGTSPPDVNLNGIPDLQGVWPLNIEDETYATNAFFRLAKAVPHERLLYFVSWARVLGKNWGSMMMDAMDTNADVGVLGTSAGWESLSADTPFPNPNIRTTGFMIDRKLFVSIEPETLDRKYDGNLFEAGPQSMTRRIEALGLLARIIGRDGRMFSKDQWPESGTFRSRDQENLLFADNRTKDYAFARRSKRLRLARLNYGDRADVRAVNLFARLARRARWHLGI